MLDGAPGGVPGEVLDAAPCGIPCGTPGDDPIGIPEDPRGGHGPTCPADEALLCISFTTPMTSKIAGQVL